MGTGPSISQTFTAVGQVQWTVPANVYYLSATVSGASGKDTIYLTAPCIGGKGAIMSANFTVVPNEVLYINVGGEGTLDAGGYNGGGTPGIGGVTYQSGGGGGATDIRRSPYEFADRLIVAGGGGGTICYSLKPGGGNGGYPNGASGTNGGSSYVAGGGGTSFSGGSAGSACSYAGDFGVGGSMCGNYGGGGGGGWYGGGAGFAAGGGGGSSFFTGALVDHGVRSTSGNGYVKISYIVGAHPPPPSASPTLAPTVNPSVSPSLSPTVIPTRNPSVSPSVPPSCSPSVHPTANPSVKPSPLPTSQPSSQPSAQPSRQPSRQPSCQPSRQPSCQPSRQPSTQPSTQPSGQPSKQPSSQPSRQPTAQPSRQPTSQPYATPTNQPSGQPSRQPSSQPSAQPSRQPISQPSGQPSRQPSIQPSLQPTSQPYASPTNQPSGQPSRQPSSPPSSQPTARPSEQPSTQPTSHPSIQPTALPSSQPTGVPTVQPSQQPSGRPSRQPFSQPTALPTMQPSTQPSGQPSEQPSSQPTSEPSSQPSSQPTAQPSLQPSCRPTVQPSNKPSDQPSLQPSAQPSMTPSVQPTVLPSSQPSVQPSIQPSSLPSAQSTVPPTAQPSARPTLQPASQPSSQPSAKPSAQPLSRPSAQPSRQPSRQPSSQPSSQPICQPIVHLTPSPTRPTRMPTARPSSPSVRPTGAPTKPPTTEWMALAEGETQKVALLNNQVWSCGRDASNGSDSCRVMDGASGEVFAQYALAWEEITAVVANEGNNVIIVGKRDLSTSSSSGSESAIAYCPALSSSINCVVKALTSVTYTACSYIPYTRQFVLTGTHMASPIVTFADNTLGTVQTYSYESVTMKSLILTNVYSVPAFVGAFVAGTCVGISAPEDNYILFGWVRAFTGAMIATSLKPASTDVIVSVAGLGQAMVMDMELLDTFVAGALQLSDNSGTNAYIVRVNSLYQSVLYGVRYRYTVGGRRRKLSDSSAVTSAVKGMALVGTTLYALVQTIRTSGTSVTILQVNAASGAIIKQVHIEGSDARGNISCTDIVRTTQALAIGCTLQSTLSHVESAVIALDTALSFSALPAGFVRSTDIRFTAESVGFTASPFSVRQKSAFIPISQSSLTSTRDGYTEVFPTTIVPTDAPAISPTVPPSAIPSVLPSNVPSSLPSSSPSAAPSISPQPTSQPSTSGPTNTYKPTVAPTEVPTRRPSLTPSARPSTDPSVVPTAKPSVQPSLQPSVQSSVKLTTQPSRAPSVKPTSLLSTARPSSLKPSIGHSLDPSEAPTLGAVSRKTSAAGVTGYVIGCSVVGNLLLAALCAWVYYTNKKLPKHKKNNQNTKVFPAEPPKITIIVDDLAVYDDRYNPQMVVPVVDMNDRGDLHAAKVPLKSKVVDSSIPSSISGAIPSSSPAPVASSAQLFHSDNLTSNIKVGAVKPHELPQLVHLPYVNTPCANNEHIIPAGIMSSNSSLHSVSTDSTDTSGSSHSSVHSVSTDSSDTEDDSV